MVSLGVFYDLNGNMTSSGTDGFTWDARNRLVSTLSGASFQYDAFGRRASKTIAGTTTSFLYDRANAVQEVIGGTNTANSLSGGVDEVFQRTDSAGARSFLTDAVGSSIALTDASGTLQTQYTFEPFGNTTTNGSATTNSFAYTGRELDAGNLYFYRARYYSAALQRFISEDPARFAGGINVYAYVGNGPTSLTDPFGLSPHGAGRGCGVPFDPLGQKTLNRCAGELSQAFSLNPAPGNFLADALFGNSFGTIAQAALGPNETNARAQLIVDNPIPKASLNGLVQAGIAAIPTGGVATSLSIPVSYFPGTYNPISLVQTATTVGDTALGAGALALLELVTAGKLVFDAGVYIGALYVCAQQ